MVVSKTHDETSRTTGSPEDQATPAPTSEDIQSAKLAMTSGGARRPRVGAVVPRERSGPIGIASGDFSTPSVRRRTTTQPRGTPVAPAAGMPLSLPMVAEPEPAVPEPAEAQPSEPGSARSSESGSSQLESLQPQPVEHVAAPPAQAPPLPSEETPLPIGATPVDLVDGSLSGQAAAALPPPTDSPFGATPVDGEASALAAEAAAVRALDSGPLTPPPEIAYAGPTPPPEPKAAAEPEPPMVPPPVPEETQPTPPPVVVAAAAIAPPPLPMPEPLEAPNVGVEGALPVWAMASDGSVASSDLANPIGSPTPVPAPEDDVDLQGSDELEVEEAAEASLLADSEPTPPPRPAITPAPTPPPIPGSSLKTPGPELKPALPSAVEEAHGPLLAGLPILPTLPEALSQRPRRPKRSKPWFEEVFDEDYLRTLPFLRADQTLREVEFISEALTAAPGSEILDVGCGYGRHAIELVQRGFNVTGLDLSLPLLIRAADEAQRRALSVNFVHADMREMAFEKQFDGAYSMLTSFGYFDEETNLRVAERIGRALKPGGRFLLDILNRDYVVADLPVRVWWEGTGCVVLEEVDFNFHTSRINTHRSVVFEDGRQLEQELSVRAYSLHEIGRLLRQAGFRVIDVSGGLATRGDFFGSASRNLLIVAEKREDEG
jgi:SAM-dependent methyltransferase